MLRSKKVNSANFCIFVFQFASMEKNLNQTFEELLNRYVNSIEKNYQSRFKRAKDKDFVKKELNQYTDLFYAMISETAGTGKILAVFSDRYKRGEDMNTIISHLKKTFGEVEDILPLRKIVDGKRITLYLSEEDKALKILALDERKLLKFLIRAIGQQEIQKRLPTMFDEKKDLTEGKVNSVSYPVKWTSQKDNKNEFVQLIYSLHKAGLINEGRGEITKIIEKLAEVFKIDLGKGWQANHSSSIHRAKQNYQPLIFHKIQSAYQQYISEQLTLKKNKK